MRWLLALFALLMFVSVGEPQFAIFQVGGAGAAINVTLKQQNVFGAAASVLPSQYYTPGTGNPAVSTSDYYHLDGIYGMRPYDLLDPACGAAGASIAASKGRYAWLASADHPIGNPNWLDGADLRIGYSSDPGILPSKMDTFYLLSNNNTVTSGVVVGGTGGIASSTLAVSSVTSGAVSSTAVLSGAGVTGGTTISNFNGVQSGAGLTGNYAISAPATITNGTTLTLSQTGFQLYQFPWLVCNPDDASHAFYIYGEGDTVTGVSALQHEEGVILSNDLVTFTNPVPSHVTPTFGNWSSFQRVVRDGVNSWHSTGLKYGGAFGYFLPSYPSYGEWTSTDGLNWTAASTATNQCLPTVSSPNGQYPCANGDSTFLQPNAPDSIVVGGQSWQLSVEQTGTGGVYFQPDYLTRAPIDGSFNLITSPATVQVSSSYDGIFPGPGQLQNAGGYVEDGIGHYYAEHGFFVSAQNFFLLNDAPYGTPAYGVGRIDNGTIGNAGTVLTVSSLSTGTPIGVPSQVGGGLNGAVAQGTTITAQTSGPAGGVGTYTVNTSQSVGSGQMTFDQGGLWQENIDYYTECTNSAVGVNAAPYGVIASASGGVVSLSWYVNPCSTGATYRVYRGTSPSSQPNLVGNVTGTSTTETPNLQVPQVAYYKVVTLNGGTEEKSRVVSVYVSSSTASVNAHINRVLAAGADPATVDRTWLDTVDSWLTTNSLSSSLMFWSDPAFGVIQNTSGVVSKVFDYGTSRLPRGGDLTFCTGSPCTSASTTTYSPVGLPVGIGGTTPAWTNPNANSFAFYGGAGLSSALPGRLNNIRRKTQLSVFAAYQKPNTNTAVFLGMGEFGGVNLQHTSGTPGNASFCLTKASTTCTSFTATVATSGATAFHVIGGTFDGTTTIAYADGTAGSGVTGYTSNPNLGSLTLLDGNLNSIVGGTNYTASSSPFLGSGAQDSKYTYGTGYQYDANQAQFTASDLIVFEKALTPTQVTSLTNLITNRVTPPTAITSVAAGGISMGSPAIYNITAMPSGASATCNTGSPVDDSAAFTNFKNLASAWDAANPNATGSIVLNIPNSTCWFLQGGGAVHPVQWTMNPSGYAGQQRVRVVATGASSKLSDGGTGGGFTMGGGGMWSPADNLHQTRVATVSRGATTLPFTACPGAGCAAALALFSPGAKVMLTGVDLQGSGQPTNPGIWNFLTVNTVTATGITTTTPITHDYKSTWPNYSTGTGGSPDQGGPGTLYVLDPTWDMSVEWNGLILDQGAGSGGATTNGKSIVVKNATIINGTTSCLGPSVNQLFAWIKVVGTSCVVEVDKIIDTFVVQNVSMTHIDFQSASVKSFIASEVAMSSYLEAGGINNFVANSAPTELKLGPHSFGASYGVDYILGNNIPTLTLSSSSTSGSIANTTGTWSGGSWTIANASISAVTGGNPALPFVPGQSIYFTGGHPSQGPMLQIADIAASGSNTVVSFNQNGSPYAGAFPTMPLNAGGADLVSHPAPQLFASGNYGSAAAIDMNQTTPGAPVGSYSKVIVAAANGTYTSPIAGPPTVGGNVSSPYSPLVWGLLTETDWTITAACGSASNFEWAPTNPVQIIGSASTSTWAPTANALVASTTPRQLFPTTTAGGQSMDNLLPPGAGAWVLNGQDQPAYATVANCGSASTTVTTTTNQGVVNPSQY